jgi:type IV pilus assembly protein PilE
MHRSRPTNGVPAPTDGDPLFRGVATKRENVHMSSPLATPAPPAAPRRRPAATRGFTLIELLIAIVVIALLAMVAYPSYLDSIRKSRRSDAFTALAAVQQAQERWRSNRSAYTTALTAAPDADPPGLGLPATSPKGYYTTSVDAADGTGYTLTATAATGTSQVKDEGCQRLRIRADGGNLFYGAAGLEGEFDESPANRCWAR